MALFKIEKGLGTNLFSKRPDTHEGWCYFTTDEGKMYIDIQDGTGTAKNPKYRVALNAATADVAQKLLTENVGSSTRPVYFDGGVPVECVDFLPLTAGPDKKLAGPLGLKKDIGYGAELPEDGFEGQVFFLDDQTPDLPLGGTTGQVLVKNSDDDKDASWTSEFAGNAASANMLNSNAGSGDKPVYFDGGVPVACDDILNVSVKGSAANWTTARDFIISDGTNTGSAVSVDGTKAITLKLPTTIQATLKGNADTATNASAADKLNSDAGSSTVPVYFDSGIPIPCESLSLDTTGSAAKWTAQKDFTISDSTGTNTGAVTKVDGSGDVNIKLPTTIKATLNGNADTATNASAANKLNSDAGSDTKPIYFDGGVPVECEDTLDVNVTGTSSAWTTARNFTISDGTNTGTPSSVDGSDNVTIKLPTTITATLKGNADTATNANAADKLNSSNGSSTVPVYFDQGLPVSCDSLSLNTTGSAAKWTSQVNFTISSSDGTGAGEVSKVDGSEDVNIKLPATIKANLTGTASEATHAVSADRLGDLTMGSVSTPVYFDNGIPVDCTSPLALDTSGNAATATKWQEDRTFVITDADGTHSGENVIVNGTEDITLTLPAEIKATLKGTADLAKALTEDAGSATKPVYFDGGIPTDCNDTLDVSITGNANTATTASKLSVNEGDTSTPVYFVDGLPKACTSTVASKLSTNAGNTNTPVYFADGIPKPCTSLDLSTSGNAGSANKLNTSAGNKYTPVYFNQSGLPEAVRNINMLGDLTEEFENYFNVTVTEEDFNFEDISPIEIKNFIKDIQPAMLPEEEDFNYRVITFYITFQQNLFKEDAYLKIEYTLRLFPNANNMSEIIAKMIVCYLNDTDGVVYTDTLYANAEISEDSTWEGPWSEYPVFLDNIVALPEGGEAGQALIKNSTNDGDASWQNISAFPKILTATYDASDTTVTRYTVNGNDQLKDGLAIAIKLNATTAGPTNSFVLNYNNSGDKVIYDSRGVAMTSYRAREKYILILTYSSIDDCWYSVANPEPLWPINYSHTTKNEKCYLIGYNVSNVKSTYGINTVQRNQNVYMNPSTSSIYASQVYGAVWNDYAEYRTQKEIIEPGYCVASADNGQVYKTTEKFQACDGIVSDTFGFAIGETDECKTPLAVAGRVLAYCHGSCYDYHAGDTVCAGPEGKVMKMTREEIREWPDRIIGIVSEIPEYKTWGSGNVLVNNRIWIKVK